MLWRMRFNGRAAPSISESGGGGDVGSGGGVFDGGESVDGKMSALLMKTAQ